MNKAASFFQSGKDTEDPDKALQLLKKAYDLEPNNFEYAFELINSYINDCDYEEAEEILELFIAKENPEYINFWMLRAKILIQDELDKKDSENNYDEVTLDKFDGYRLINKAYDKWRTNPDVVEAVAYTYLEFKRSRKALNICDLAVSDGIDTNEINLLRAWALADIGEVQTSLEVYETISVDEIENSDFLAEYGFSLFSQGKCIAALGIYEYLNNSNRFNLYDYFSYSLLKRTVENYQKEMENLDGKLDLEPDNSAAKIKKIIILLNLGEDEEALELINQYKAGDDDYYKSVRLKGVYLQKSGRKREAADCFNIGINNINQELDLIKKIVFIRKNVNNQLTDCWNNFLKGRKPDNKDIDLIFLTAIITSKNNSDLAFKRAQNFIQWFIEPGDNLWKKISSYSPEEWMEFKGKAYLADYEFEHKRVYVIGSEIALHYNGEINEIFDGVSSGLLKYRLNKLKFNSKSLIPLIEALIRKNVICTESGVEPVAQATRVLGRIYFGRELEEPDTVSKIISVKPDIGRYDLYLLIFSEEICHLRQPICYACGESIICVNCLVNYGFCQKNR